jgi:hypothetical protein
MSDKPQTDADIIQEAYADALKQAWTVYYLSHMTPALTPPVEAERRYIRGIQLAQEVRTKALIQLKGIT